MEMKPISVKVPVGVLERIDAEAKALGLTRTALLLRPWEGVPSESVAAVAQRLERPPVEREVAGSSPVGSATPPRPHRFPVGHVYRETRPDPKSAAPTLFKKLVVIGHDDDGKEIWEDRSS